MIRIAPLAAAALLLAGPASAHGLRLTLTPQPGCLSGQVEYSDGWPGEDEPVTITRIDAPAAPVKVRADAAGRFSADLPGGRYRVLVVGDEEHEVEREADVPAAPPGAACPRPAFPTSAPARTPRA